MEEKDLVPQEIIESKILLIRGKKVMFDRDLAVLYGVETKALKQAVKRNPKRFPQDFMFELTLEELNNWRSQFVTSNALVVVINVMSRISIVRTVGALCSYKIGVIYDSL
ncbi:MAG: ORF6N domain-containing protein [Deltaproteobacteria bacterium]|nr:ORF6N domain-containing protein [Deltaproteobacteria bacterium]